MENLAGLLILFPFAVALGYWLTELYKKCRAWQPGRQGSGYSKLELHTSKRFMFDLWLLKFPKGSYIGWHTDPTPSGYEHHRLNIVLKKAYGGLFKVDGEHRGSLRYGRINYFRPDITRHRVTEVLEGTRWVLSIGWARKVRK